jgi:hypothetical protein
MQGQPPRLPRPVILPVPVRCLASGYSGHGERIHHVNPSEQRNAFRAAIERQDHDALMQVFTPDVVFHSPIVYHSSVGRAALAPLLAAVLPVFTDFRYLGEYDAIDGKVLQFHARLGGRDLDGVDILTFDTNGFVREFTVMIRPYSAATVLRDMMAAKRSQGD